MMDHFSPGAKELRSTELDEILDGFEREPETMRAVKNANCWVDAESRVSALDAIAESTLFAPQSPEWEAMLRELPDTWKGEGGDRYNGAIYLHLWTISPLMTESTLEDKLLNGALDCGPVPDIMEERLETMPSATRAESARKLGQAREERRNADRIPRK